MYDFIIIGGGISGFYCALELLKKNKNVCICEKYKDIGGRISTFHKEKYMWEGGAGRISTKHTMILDLLKHYKQPIVSIDSKIHYIDNCIEPNIFEDLITIYFTPFKTLHKDILATHTLRELCIKTYGKDTTDTFLLRFPYRAEVDVLRADLALDIFINGEMSSHEKYLVATNGLSALIESMKNDFITKGGILFTEYKCIHIDDFTDYITTEFLIKKTNKIFLKSKKIICAMESEALKKINFFNSFKTLDYLKMEPLLRTYAVYDSPWFSQYTRIVTSNPIRYFLPINYQENIAMISYTDSSDTNKFHSILNKYGEESLGKHIQNLLKKLFGSIPNYIFFKSHYWKYGATYWLPGKYDPYEESQKSLKPFNSEVYVVNESFSLKQAWMEGSLEQCKKLLDIIL